MTDIAVEVEHLANIVSMNSQNDSLYNIHEFHDLRNSPDLPDLYHSCDSVEINSVLQKHALCSICKSLITHPMTIICQHSFCYECLQLTIQNRVAQMRNSPGYMHLPASRRTSAIASAYTCPVCRDPFTMPKKTKHNTMIESIITDMIPVKQQEIRHRQIHKRGIEEDIKEEIRVEFLNQIQLQAGEIGIIPDQNVDTPGRRPELRSQTHPNSLLPTEIVNGLEKNINGFCKICRLLGFVIITTGIAIIYKLVWVN